MWFPLFEFVVREPCDVLRVVSLSFPYSLSSVPVRCVGVGVGVGVPGFCVVFLCLFLLVQMITGIRPLLA